MNNEEKEVKLKRLGKVKFFPVIIRYSLFIIHLRKG